MATTSSSSSSLPRRPYDPLRLFILPIPDFLSKRLSLGRHKRALLVHLAGALFALGWWCFVDAVIMSGKHRRAAAGGGGGEGEDGGGGGVGPYVTFADWSTGLIATRTLPLSTCQSSEELTPDALLLVLIAPLFSSCRSTAGMLRLPDSLANRAAPRLQRTALHPSDSALCCFVHPRQSACSSST